MFLPFLCMVMAYIRFFALCQPVIKNCSGLNYCPLKSFLKVLSAIFHSFTKWWPLNKCKIMFVISSKKLFLFSRYSSFCVCISIFPAFFPVDHCFRGWSKINLNKNLITQFVWYLEEKNLWHWNFVNWQSIALGTILRKIIQKICTKSRSQTPF